MSEFNRTESAKFALETQKVVGDLQGGADKALAEAASRGFSSAPGVTLAIILTATQDAKGKLTESNGKIFEERLDVIYKQEEFLVKMVVHTAKLGMELYRAELLNAMEIEQAQMMADRDSGLADVLTQTAVVEARQAGIITARAEAERQVIGYKVALANAERQTLEAEVGLANAQLATATAKLAIIDSIFQVVAAEEMVLAAERAKISAEQAVLAAKQALAGVKQGMIGGYAAKAAAKESLAGAIAAEVPSSIALANLGYDRAALKSATGEAEHGVRVAELQLEVARAAAARSSVGVEIARAQAQATIAAASNAAQEGINTARASAGSVQISTRMADRLGHAAIEVNTGLGLANHEAATISSELGSILSNIASRAASEAAKIAASANKKTINWQTHLISRRIVEGFW